MHVFEKKTKKQFLRIFKTPPFEKNIFLRLGIKGENNSKINLLTPKKFKKMKKVLSVLAIAALFVVSFSSCGGGKTAAELLTQKKGWVLSSATSDPAYQLSDGSQAQDLISDKYLEDFEVAYVIFFNENGNEIVKPGKVVAPENFDPEWCYRAETSLGNWSFDNAENPSLINMQIPFFYDDAQEICYLKSLTENELRIQCVMNDEDNPAKQQCTFTLTYVPAK